MTSLESYAVVAVRLVSLIWACVALCWLLANVAVSWSAFNPTYWYYYFEMQLLRPLIFLLMALLLRVFAVRIARSVGKGL